MKEGEVKGYIEAEMFVYNYDPRCSTVDLQNDSKSDLAEIMPQVINREIWMYPN